MGPLNDLTAGGKKWASASSISISVPKAIIRFVFRCLPFS